MPGELVSVGPSDLFVISQLNSVNRTMREGSHRDRASGGECVKSVSALNGGGLWRLLFVPLLLASCVDPDYHAKQRKAALDYEYVQPGFQRPPMRTAEEAELKDEDVVIGVVINGVARAYSIQAMSDFNENGMLPHVLNDVIERTPVSVTFCDLKDCARVFTKHGAHQPLELGIGGWADQEMQLMLDGVKFSQSAKDAPLADLEFTRTDWKSWRTEHPETLVFVDRHYRP